MLSFRESISSKASRLVVRLPGFARIAWHLKRKLALVRSAPWDRNS